MKQKQKKRVSPSCLLLPISLVVSFLLVQDASANVRDVLLPKYLPEEGCTCADWTDVSSDATEQARIDGYWADGKAPSDADNFCAMPAASAGRFECDGCTVDKIYNSFKGPWCYCKEDGKKETYCVPPKGIPEQINLQIAATDVVVASFVSFDVEVPGPNELPVAMIGTDPSTLTKSVNGISHPYAALSKVESTNYTLSFVKFANLEPRQVYYYKVKPGAKNSQWSDVFKFRAPYASGETRIAAYGDMGHSHYDCMANIGDDCSSGVIDAVLHMGDHAYDMGNGHSKRGDAYLNAYSQNALSGCPWIPVIGNHEANDGDHSNRYLNLTYGETLGGGDEMGSSGDIFERYGVSSTAEFALTELLSKTTLLAATSHSGTPSGTSRYFSVNVGLMHFANIDLNNGISVGDVQYRWLLKDLASVDRSLTPWVFVTSHFPMYHATDYVNFGASAKYYRGEGPEKYATSGHEYKVALCNEDGEECELTLGELLRSTTSVLDPVMQNFSVDVYNAGHVHDYCSTWPICHNLTTGTSDVCADNTDNFVNPSGTVHVTEGNGGVPGVVGTSTLKDCSSTDWCRKHGTGGAYGRWIAHNATHLTYEHVQNNGGAVTDTFTISKA